MDFSDEKVTSAPKTRSKRKHKQRLHPAQVSSGRDAPSISNRLLPAFVLLPAFLGGATERWSQGAVLLGLGLLLLVFPPRRSAGFFFNTVALGILGCAGAAFLPARWFSTPLWRTEALENCALSFGSLATVQPWLTAEGFVLLAGGVAWFLFVCSQKGELDRQLSARRLCAGVAVLAAVSIFLHYTGRCWPVGTSIAKFGPFPNRNQTADLLALSSVLAMAAAHEDFRRKNRIWILTLLGCGAMLWGLLLTGSRAGAVLCFFGTALWAGCMAVLRRSGRRFGAVVGVLLILLGAFLLGGGETLDRFLPSEPLVASSVPGSNLRWLIQRDAFDLAKSAPLFGFGLSNFDSIFWLSPHHALGGADFHVLHPESDWLWLWVELGWPALLLTVCGLALVIAAVFPMGSDADWRLRAAATAAVLVFAIHGAVDVPAHRLGTVFPALFICALAMAPKRESQPSLFIPVLFRISGAAFCVIGALWVTGAGGDARIAAKQRAATAIAAGNYAVAATHAQRAIQWAPLDWEPYYQRAVATALGGGDWQAALADFRRARFLNPTTADLPFKEGLVWLKVHPSLVLSAWQEALNRCAETRAGLYENMLSTTGTASGEIRAALWELADGNNPLTLLFLDHAPQGEFQACLKKVLTEDPELDTFTAPQKRTLIRLWAAKADRSELVRQVEARQAWMASGWESVACVYGAGGDFRHAFETARRHINAPAPRVGGMGDAPIEIRRAFYANPRDFAKGHAFCEMEARKDKTEEAMQILQNLIAQENCPGYIYLLRADILARAERWQEAWQALNRGRLLNP